MGDAEGLEWGWGGRPAAAGLRSLPHTPSPRGRSLEGQAAGGKGQPRGGVPAPLGAAPGLSTKVRLKRDMALVPQATAAMGIAGPAQFFLHRPEKSGEAPTEGRDQLLLHRNRLGAAEQGAGVRRPARPDASRAPPRRQPHAPRTRARRPPGREPRPASSPAHPAQMRAPPPASGSPPLPSSSCSSSPQNPQAVNGTRISPSPNFSQAPKSYTFVLLCLSLRRSALARTLLNWFSQNPPSATYDHPHHLARSSSTTIPAP